jgi:hypothetical protein
MAAEASEPGINDQASLADRLEWLCQVARLERACASKNRLAACEALERQLDHALLHYASGRDNAALAICDRLSLQTRTWTSGLWT